MGIRVLGSLSSLALRVIIALLAFALMASEIAFAVSDQDHWENTRISESHLQSIINDKNCYQSESNFLGCIQAINALLATATPSKTLSNKKIENIEGMKVLIQDIERIQIRVFISPEDRTRKLYEYWPDYVAQRNSINQSWIDIYRLTQKNPLSLTKILLHSLLFVDKSSYYKYKIANALNAFYGTAIDPHTRITTLTQFNETVSIEEEHKVGLGMYVRKFNSQFVLEPIEGTLTEAKGIKLWDVLQSVNGKNVEGMTSAEVVDLLRGPENSSVSVEVLRGKQKLRIALTREKYTVRNISSKILNDPLRPHKKIGYIKLLNFTEKNICQKFINAAKSLRNQGAEALILDLRNNRGGFRAEVTCIASTYINEGELIVTNHDIRTNATLPDTDHNYHAKGGPQIFNLYNRKPLIILQNANSASASELLAGALATHGRGLVTGERSYGKGTSQKGFHSKANAADGFILRQTYARFHFASGATNQIVGITPDFIVHSSPNPTEEELFALREADEFTNAIETNIAPVGLPKYVVDKINDCVQVRSVLQNEYGSPQSKLSMDYQLLTTREIATCIIGK